MVNDPVNHPSHYTSHPSGVECIQITEHMSFNTGNALKYIWRADLKNDAIEDMHKAIFYIEREIARREIAGFQANTCDDDNSLDKSLGAQRAAAEEDHYGTLDT